MVSLTKIQFLSEMQLGKAGGWPADRGWRVPSDTSGKGGHPVVY